LNQEYLHRLTWRWACQRQMTWRHPYAGRSSRYSTGSCYSSTICMPNELLACSLNERLVCSSNEHEHFLSVFSSNEYRSSTVFSLTTSCQTIITRRRSRMRIARQGPPWPSPESLVHHRHCSSSTFDVQRCLPGSKLFDI